MKTGDVIISSSIFPLVKHYGIIICYNNQTLVAHNSYSTGCIEIDTYNDFKKTRQIHGIIPTEKTINPEQLLNEVNEIKQQKRYDFFNYNCEDFVKQVCGCVIGNDQRIIWLYFGLMILIKVILFIIFIKIIKQIK